MRKVIHDIQVGCIDQYRLKTPCCNNRPVDQQDSPWTNRIMGFDVLADLFINCVHDLVYLGEER